MNQDRVRVLRLVEYEGPREWVEATVAKSLQGTKEMKSNGQPAFIRTATLGSFPEILAPAKETSHE